MGAEPVAANSQPGTIEVGDFKIESGQASTEQLEEQFRDDIEAATKEAASKLGKRGAKARKQKAEASREEGAEEAAESPEPEEAEEATEKKASKSESEEDEETEDKSEKPDKGKKLGNPKHDPRARMLEATRQLADERRAHQETRSQIDELRAEIQALKTPKAEPKAEARPKSDKPDPESFGTFEEYLDARDDWNKNRWTEEFHQESQRRAQLSEQDRVFEAARQKFAGSVGMAEGWEELATSLVAEFQLPQGEQPTGKNWIANELFFSPESAPALGLYLQGHPDEFQRIAALPTPRDVSRAMASLEARLEAATNTGLSPERVEKSKAAPPVRPVKGAAYVGAEQEAPKPGEDYDSWYRRVGHKIKF